MGDAVSKRGRGAEIDQARIDLLAAAQLDDQLRRPVADAAILDIDQGPVTGLDHVAGDELSDAVRPDDLEIGTRRQDATVEPRALHDAAGDRDDAPLADGRLTDLDRWRDADLEIGHMLEPRNRKVCHGLLRSLRLAKVGDIANVIDSSLALNTCHTAR
ncbi:hypothetical protein SAMN05519103_05152 [Rhizobiales bacterium GAS113]|nr:hypothetical protein SAMN05519103_05152 [Rhizobiales bacterium GAS113]